MRHLFLMYRSKVFGKDHNRVPLFAREEVQVDQYNIYIDQFHNAYHRSVKAGTGHDSAPRYQFAQSCHQTHPLTLPDSTGRPHYNI